MPPLIIAALVAALLSAPGCGRKPESQSVPGPRTESYSSRVDSSQVGRPMSLRDAYPDYQPGKDDPEFESTITGRRKVARHDRPLSEGGATSLKSLLEQVAIAVDAADGTAVQRLSVSRSDFETILWPEMPQSRPAANVPAGEAWDFLYNRNMAGYNRAMGDLHATGIRLKSFKIGKTIEYTNYRLLDEMTVEVEQADHQPVTLDLVRTVVERDGRFKIYSTRD